MSKTTIRLSLNHHLARFLGVYPPFLFHPTASLRADLQEDFAEIHVRLCLCTASHSDSWPQSVQHPSLLTPEDGVAVGSTHTEGGHLPNPNGKDGSIDVNWFKVHKSNCGPAEAARRLPDNGPGHTCRPQRMPLDGTARRVRAVQSDGQGGGDLSTDSSKELARLN